MTPGQIAALVHAAGFGTGIVLYAMLGAMLLREQGVPHGRRDRIPVATAVLGLLWNAGALVRYGAQDAGAAEPWTLVGAVAFAALGFLPAVAVHAALQGAPAAPARALRVATWLLGGIAAALQGWAAVAEGVTPSRPALQLLTFGYAAVLPLVALVLRGRPGARGPLVAAALGGFAVMALHLGHHVAGRESLWAELLGHHASLPLALVILYQDYRFALADLFLKRVLAVVTLVTAALGVHVLVGSTLLLPRLARTPGDPVATAGLLALWTGTALLYPYIRRLAGTFVDRVVLRRPDYARVRRELDARLEVADGVEAALEATCATLAPALAARELTWRPSGPTDAARRTTASIAVVTAMPPAYLLEVGALAGGRRLLSDDLALLEAAANAAARRIDAVRLGEERVARAAREQELGRLTSEAELRALRAQLNPHFLFNALTTVGYLMQEAPERALVALYRLTDLLRAVLRGTGGGMVTLGEELEIVEAYLAVERERFEERLQVVVDVPPELRALRVPPLLLQPLVENAVKHGISASRAGGTVRVAAAVDGDALSLVVADTGAGANAPRRPGTGVGLANVERRLAHQYGARASLAFRSAPGEGTVVELRLPHARAPHEAEPPLAGAAS